MTEDDFEEVRSQLTERQIKILSFHVGEAALRPSNATQTDVDVLLDFDLIEYGEGMLRKNRLAAIVLETPPAPRCTSLTGDMLGSLGTTTSLSI